MEENKPLLVYFLGINRTIDDFNLQPSIYNSLDHKYDSLYITTESDELITEEQIHNKLQIIQQQIQDKNVHKRNNIVFVTHSFGSIFALYMIKILDIQDKTSIIMIDPSTKYHIKHIEKISQYLKKILDDVPKDIKSKTLVISYLPKKCPTLIDCPKKESDLMKSRISHISDLFEDLSNVQVELINIAKETKNIAHNLHKINPQNTLHTIQTFLSEGGGFKRKSRKQRLRKKRSTRKK